MDQLWINLIIKDIKEILGFNDLSNICKERIPTIYWGTAPTGTIHIGYFIPILKIADFVKAGCNVKILIADLHAYLDNMKSTLDQIEHRVKYYIIMITEMLKFLDVDMSKIEFVVGRDFQMSPAYIMDVYKINSMVTLTDAKHAGAEVVKQSDNPMLSGLMYPLLQCLDHQHLGVDCQLGGNDQRKIFAFSHKIMPKMGYKKGIQLMTPMLSGLRFKSKDEVNNDDDDTTNKMSASEIETKIDLLDSKKMIGKKINKTYCLLGNVDDNCLLELLEKVIFPIAQNKQISFIINRKEEYGGQIIYDKFDHLKNDFQTEALHPGDLKLGVSNFINFVLEPIRSKFLDNSMKELLKKAYGK